MRLDLNEFKAAHGTEVSKDIYDYMLNHFIISKHAIERLKDRKSSLIEQDAAGQICFKGTKEKIRAALKKPYLAYFNTDGSINAATGPCTYFVFTLLEDAENFLMVTYKEPSWFGMTIDDKRRLALQGVDRKEEGYDR